jgi:hypothetical protein
MPTAKGGYFLADGSRVPSVTTVISKFKDCGGLLHWAWKLGMEGKDYRQVRDDAASAGTLAHKLVEQWARNEPLSITGEMEVVTKAEIAFSAFKEWAAQSKLEIVQTELPLISERYRFGGTMDAVLVNGKRSIGDWKSSNSIYPEYLVQVAAYGMLWLENFPDQPIDGGYHLMKFSKDHPDFAHFHWSELEDAKRAFLLLRELYDLKAGLEKRAK